MRVCAFVAPCQTGFSTKQDPFKFSDRLVKKARQKQGGRAIVEANSTKQSPVNNRTAKVFWKVVVFLGAVGAFCAFILWPPHAAGPELVAKTCDALRQQGFKTDLSQFNFSTPPEMRTREAAFAALDPKQSAELPLEWPVLTETVGNDFVVVVWQQDLLKWPHAMPPDGGDQVTWDEFRELFTDHQTALDAACQAALSGPIRFHLQASGGNHMLLRHLAPLKGLAQALGYRTILALHDGNPDSAWTNLLAQTRLVTAWEPEPAEVSHSVRFLMTKLVFDATWQALQTNAWPEARLAQLQAEWEATDFLTNLSEVGEFKLAADAADYDFDRRQNLRPGQRGGDHPPFSEFVRNAIRSPWSVWSEMRYNWNRAHYARGGQYEEERDLLLYDRDREIELRNAVQAPTWAQMIGLPGVTNTVPFHSKYYSSVQARRASSQMAKAFQSAGGGFLGHAAQAETQRRMLIVALALERYHGQHGAYPPALTALAPEFVKTVPDDFMDGRPLRYQLNDAGHYRLYSVGLDGVDDGGKMAKEERLSPAELRSGGLALLPKGDLVWPFPASTATAAELRRQQSAVFEKKADDLELIQAEAQWKHAANHQRAVEELLAAPAPNLPDVKYQGQPLSEWLRNPNTAGVNEVALCGLFTLKQIMTGGEPEQAAFELPIRYDALKHVGEIYLLIDTNNDDADEGCVVQQMDCRRADNGDCLLVWDTIYESPGKHALRAGFEVHGGSSDNETLVGPPLPFVVSNLCQFSTSSAHFDPRLGAAFQLRLPEMNGRFVLKCQTTDGALLKTITGATTNGIVNVRWDLKDEQGRRLSADIFNSLWTITLPDSGRSQTLKGP